MQCQQSKSQQQRYQHQASRCRRRNSSRRFRRSSVVWPPIFLSLSSIDEEKELESELLELELDSSEANIARFDRYRNGKYRYCPYCVFYNNDTEQQHGCGCRVGFGCCNSDEEKEEDWDVDAFCVCSAGRQRYLREPLGAWRVTLLAMMMMVFVVVTLCSMVAETAAGVGAGTGTATASRAQMPAVARMDDTDTASSDKYNRSSSFFPDASVVRGKDIDIDHKDDDEYDESIARLIVEQFFGWPLHHQHSTWQQQPQQQQHERQEPALRGAPMVAAFELPTAATVT